MTRSFEKWKSAFIIQTRHAFHSLASNLPLQIFPLWRWRVMFTRNISKSTGILNAKLARSRMLRRSEGKLLQGKLKSAVVAIV